MSNYITSRLQEVKKENWFIKTFVLEAKIEAQPGQFVMVWLPRINEKPFSLAGANPVTLTVAKVGPFTRLLHQLKKGEQLSFRGPYGKPFKPVAKAKVLMVAGGYGVVPLYFLARTLSYKKGITVILGAKSKKDLALTKEFKKLGVNPRICTDDGSCGFKGFTTDLAVKILSKEPIKQIYSCGPKPMMAQVARLAWENKIPCQLSLESYMKCGLGLCGECTFGQIRVCQDGPVISAKQYLENSGKLET
jgi:dihydroorotate dehydrogenase electron transfer subunit